MIDKLQVYRDGSGHGDRKSSLFTALVAYTLCFIQLHLYCANAKSASADAHIEDLWASMIWLTSLYDVAKMTKCNLVYETTALVFLVAQCDVRHP